ncbi:MAG: hypothetical protein J7M19_06815 [Planctomycetes bacterium]|nr:hypothetical protein [Planctomycetota bacterium]
MSSSLKRSLAGLAVSAGVIAVMVWAFHIISREPGGGTCNPYEYDLSNLTKTPPELIGYRETGQIKTGFRKPTGIAVCPCGNVWTTGDLAVAVFEPDGNEIRRFKLANPAQCIALSADDRVFLGVENHIETCNPYGGQQNAWSGLGENAFLTSIAVTGTDVFAADYGNRTLWHFDTSGKLLGRIGGPHSLEGTPGFIVPSPYFDLALGANGSLWVADPGRLRVEEYTYDGRMKGAWGEASMKIEGFCGCCNPTHIALLPDSSFVTSEKGLARVKLHGPDGKFKCVVAGPEQFAEGTVGLDLAVDSSGDILVLDPKAGAVRIFTKKTAPDAKEVN